METHHTISLPSSHFTRWEPREAEAACGLLHTVAVAGVAAEVLEAV